MGEFERCLARVLVHEGGYVNNPKDPGGATNQGITQAVYDDYLTSIKQKHQPVKQMSTPERDAIYRIRYWALIKGDSLPPGISYVVFDGAVNSGVAQSVKWLQRAVGVNADGVIGTETLNAVRAFQNYPALVDGICDKRLAFLKALKTWRTFGGGWSRRVDDVHATGKAWATGSSAPETVSVPGTSSKATVDAAKSMPVMAIADAATGGGIGAGGLAETLRQAQDQLMPLSSSSHFLSNVVAGLVVASATLTVGGLAYRWWATRRRAELKEAFS